MKFLVSEELYEKIKRLRVKHFENKGDSLLSCPWAKGEYEDDCTCVASKVNQKIDNLLEEIYYER